MERIKGISLKDLYEQKLRFADTQEEKEEWINIMWKVF